MTIADTFGRACRSARIGLDLTQDAVADAVGVSRGYVARIEAGQANATLEVIERIGAAVGLTLNLVAIPPIFLSERRPHDLVHARCSAAIRRRLISSGWQVEAEVDVSDGRIHGWADLVAFHPSSRTLLIIEIKTRLDDFGTMQRQVRWYERHGVRAIAPFGWIPQRVSVWLVCLSSAEVDSVLKMHRDLVAQDFPQRSREMLAVVHGGDASPARGLAMVDPASHRAKWLLPTSIDGRRARPAYESYAQAARSLTERRSRG